MNSLLRKSAKSILRKLGLEVQFRGTPPPQDMVVSLKTSQAYRADVLLSYIIEPFVDHNSQTRRRSHTHFAESTAIVECFLQLGYNVDVISYLNTKFTPSKKYSFFVGARTNFERISQVLNRNCLKIAHLDTSHWLFSNVAAYTRALSLLKRRGVSLDSFRRVEPNRAIECADYATVLGNDYTMSTYRYALKPMYRLSVPAITVYPWFEEKDFDLCRNRYLWLGSGGLVHKGLDLVLEAFCEMPECFLTVCGPVHEEADFEKTYFKELYHTPNIRALGWVDVTGPSFAEVTRNSVGLVYPSCAEGQSGAVVTCLQAGLIPIISQQSGVDVDDFGVLLHDCSPGEIKQAIRMLSGLPEAELRRMARKAWETARANHTREEYSRRYSEVINEILSLHRRQRPPAKPEA